MKIRFNRIKYIEVHKQKLLESSEYFENMLSPRFNNHKSEFVEVNFPVNFETFERAMLFVNNNALNLMMKIFLTLSNWLTTYKWMS